MPLRTGSKKTRYNIEEDGVQDETLTHLGQSLSNFNTGPQFDGFSDDDDDDEQARQLEREAVGKLHFGGGSGAGVVAGKVGGEDGRSKTRKEIMEELIMKAKMYKAERQKVKQEDEDAVSRLDANFSDIQSMLVMAPTKKEKKAQEVADMIARLAGGKKEGGEARSEGEGGKTAAKAAKAAKAEVVVKEAHDDFNKIARGLLFEARAAASDRKKTEEEVAVDELKELEELEKQRQRRMRGIDSDSEDEDDEGGRKGKRRKGAGGKSAPTDDDLTANWYEEESLYLFSVWREICTLRNEKLHTET